MPKIKCLFVVFFLSTIFSIAYSQEKSDVQNKGLYGKVDSLDITEFQNQSTNDFVTGNTLPGPHSSNKLDEHGNQVELKYYDRSNQLVFQYAFAYDANGNLTEKVIKNPDGILITSWKYYYDKDSFPQSVEELQEHNGQKKNTVLEATKFKERKVYAYDTAGKLLSTATMAENGAELKKDDNKSTKKKAGSNDQLHLPTDKYDEEGKITERTLFNDDSSVKGKIYYKYDSKGNELEQDYYRQSDQFKTILTMNEYDNANHLLSRTMNRIDGGHGDKFNYKYDERGNRTEFDVYLWKDGYHLYKVERYNDKGAIKESESYDDNGIFESKQAKIYDSKGNLLKIMNMDKDNSITSEVIYKYKDFDNAGNWQTSCMWKVDDNVLKITKRRIVYYPLK